MKYKDDIDNVGEQLEGTLIENSEVELKNQVKSYSSAKL